MLKGKEHRNTLLSTYVALRLLAGHLVYSWAVTDPTTEHHGEDHLKYLDVEEGHTRLIQYVCVPLPLVVTTYRSKKFSEMLEM